MRSEPTRKGETMKNELTVDDVTARVRIAVNAFMLSKAAAITKREQVDKIQRAILAEFPMDIAGEWIVRGIERKGRIDDPKYIYLASDADAEFFFAECNQREREEGVKPADMPDECCPALVAESLLCDAEKAVAKAAAEMLGEDEGEFLHKLFCSGMKNYHKFTDLTARLVTNLPDFVAPEVAACA